MSQSVTRIPVRKERTWRGLLVTLLFLVLLGVVGFLWFLWFSSYDLNALMAEMDVQDPGWRLHDIEANRKAVPYAGNSALHILAIGKLLAGQPIITPALEKIVENLPPEVQLNEQQSAYLEKRFANLWTAVVEARKLKDMPQGRYPIKYTDDCLSTPMPHLQDAWRACELLQWDAALRAHGGDDEGALESCLALQNAARSMGDEPCTSSFMFRSFCHDIAVGTIERTLAQGQFAPSSEPVLKRMQEAFVRELAEPKLLIVLRGHRAGSNQFVQAVEDGKVSAASLGLVPGARTIDFLAGLSRNRGKRGPSNEVDATLLENYPAYRTRQHAAMLRFANELVDAAKLPPEEAEERFKALLLKIHDEPYLVRITGPSIIKIRDAERRTQAHLRCAVAALAAERYRLAQNCWPDTLDDLVKTGFLDAVPTDPYDGKPIRLKRATDGLILYSVNWDKIDNDGFMNHDNPADPGTDI
ncbi:MAG TPA: hypothetical protein VNX28_15190, partial [Gemmataceae bacterium]|nr:hypothetical protein [Gemmataceae bacterium]